MIAEANIIAQNRFGYGARADDAPLNDPRGWLKAQLVPDKAVPPNSRISRRPRTPLRKRSRS